MEKKSKGKSTNPIAWVPTVYFAMGLPFIAVNLVSTFMFKDLGISDTQIAFWTSIIMLPWTLKFLWSPFLEMYRTKKFFVVVTQLLSGLLFGVVAFSLKFDYFFQRRTGSRGRHAGRALRGCRRSFDTGKHACL